MAKKHLPQVTIKLSRQQLNALVAFMGVILKGDAPPGYDPSASAMMLATQLVWLSNVGIFRQWVKKSDLQSNQTTIILDADQATAFLLYWDPVEHASVAPYEANVMRTVIATIDRELSGLRLNAIKGL